MKKNKLVKNCIQEKFVPTSINTLAGMTGVLISVLLSACGSDVSAEGQTGSEFGEVIVSDMQSGYSHQRLTEALNREDASCQNHTATETSYAHLGAQSIKLRLSLTGNHRYEKNIIAYSGADCAGETLFKRAESGSFRIENSRDSIEFFGEAETYQVFGSYSVQNANTFGLCGFRMWEDRMTRTCSLTEPHTMSPPPSR